MKKATKTSIAFALAAGMILSNVSVSDAAKTKKPKLSKSKVTITVGKKVKITVKKAKPKKTTWSLPKKGKKYVALSKKTKKSVTIKAKKAGKTTLTAKIKVGKKTYKKKLKITVKNKTVKATVKPTVKPTAKPTVKPANPTVKPTATPVEPTAAPVEPTAAPVEPTAAPVEPTAAPTVAPTDTVVTPEEENGMLVYNNLDTTKDYTLKANNRECEVTSSELTKQLDRTVDMDDIYTKWTTKSNEISKTFAGVKVEIITTDSVATKKVVVSGASERINGTYTVTLDTKTANSFKVHVAKTTGAKADVTVEWNATTVTVTGTYNGKAYKAVLTLNADKKATEVVVTRDSETLFEATKNADGTYTVKVDKAEAEKRNFSVTIKN